MKVTMTLYEALQKKKIIEKKAEKAFEIFAAENIIDVKYTNQDKIARGRGRASLEEAKSEIQSYYSGTISVIKNLINIKSAINDANSRIIVRIGDKEMSIANAIVVQRNQVNLSDMYKRILKYIEDMERRIKLENGKVLSPEAISNYIATVLGDSKKDEELIQKLKSDYIKNTEISIYDPLHLKEEAAKKLEEIDKFSEEISFALTKANCVNTITVDFED